VSERGTTGLARYASFDGTEIAYLDEGEGDLVVLLHGFGSQHRERRSVDAVGYSMGSVVAARWVPEDERVRSIVLGGVGVNIANGGRLAVKGLAAQVLLAANPATLDPLARDMRQGLAEFPAAIVDFVTSSAPTHPSEDPVP
jgi:pimeloyl-ACP methyl ester carboxylesterase